MTVEQKLFGYLMLEKLSFRTLFEATSEALIISDATGHILFSNPAAQSLLGYSAQDLTGKTVEMLMPERFRGNHHHFRNAYVRRPEKRPMGKGRGLMAMTSEGRELDVHIGLSPIPFEGETYILMTMLDATQEREALRAKEESAKRLHLAQHAVMFGVFDQDLTTNEFHWDEQAKKILGIDSNDDVIHADFSSLVLPLDAVVLHTALERALDPANQGEYQVRFRFMHPLDDTVHWIESNGRILFRDNHPVRLIGIMQDVTREVMIEERLEKQRLETEAVGRRQIAGQTASAIAHELNQPLAAVSTYGEVALRELDKIDCPDLLRHAIECSFQQSQRAGNALHELLEYLRSGDVEVEEFDLKATIKSSIALEMKSGLSEFETRLDLDESIPSVLANEVQVQKVLTNLIRNALEAIANSTGHSHPVISISMKPANEAGMVEVSVEDNGPGIGQEALPRIFEPFFTTKNRGIGMGLAVSRSLIRSNGGELWAEPETASGAIIHFTLPVIGGHLEQTNLYRR